MLLKGGCCCGAIRYEATGPLFHLTSCHCPTCRRVSAAASVAWGSVRPADYRVTRGQPVSFQSSAHVTRTLCGACGTPLTYRNSALPDEIDITVCSLDDPDAHAPQDHTFLQYRLSWDVSADGKPGFPRTRAG